MLKAAISGTVWAVAALCLLFGVGFLPEFVAHPGWVIVLAYICLMATLCSAPGAFLLGLPLTSFLRLVRANTAGRFGFFGVAVLAGAPVGLVNLLLITGLAALLAGSLPQWRELRGLWLPALVGGVGLGLGVGNVVWREGRRRC